MASLPLPDKYRPHVFEDVVGQERPVRYLSGLIRSGRARNVVITGPWGAGKTTLARIYAKALNCCAPTAKGSPCGRCEHCNGFEAGSHSDYKENNSPVFGGIDGIKELIEIMRSPPLLGRRRVIVLDEAQDVTRAGFNALLKPIEEPPEHAVWMLLTTHIGAIPDALKSRCQKLYVKTLDERVAVGLLEKVCRGENFDYEDEALRLIASLSGGHARDLLQNLDQVAQEGKVTVSLTREVLSLGHGDTVVGYFNAVLDGHLETQTQLIQSWLPEQPFKKLTLIREFLLFLYYNEVIPTRLDMTVNPVLLCLTEEVRGGLVERFRQSAHARGMPLEGFWGEMMRFWGDCLDGGTEMALLVHVARFHWLVNATKPASAAGALSGPGPVAHGVRETAPKRHRFRRSGGAKDKPDFLNNRDVGELWEAASILIQEYGVLLNFRITLVHSKFGVSSHESGVQKFSHLTHELGLRLKEGSGLARFHWLCLHEHDEEQGCQSHLVAHIPEELAEKAERYVRASCVPRFFGSTSGEGLDIEVGRPRRKSSPASGRGRRVSKHRIASEADAGVQRHWDYVRRLCRGLDPELRGCDEIGRRRPLIELLGIPENMRRPAGVVQCSHRYTRSQSIGPKERKKREADKLAYLSAFGDEAWSRVADGWELQEFVDREAEKKRRRDAEAGIHSLCGGDQGRRDAELETLRRSWPEDPKARQRSWVGWWEGSEASGSENDESR